jgi:hypothetical protein
VIAVRGFAPTNRKTGFPSTNNAKVGMLITPHAPLVSGLASTSIETTATATPRRVDLVVSTSSSLAAAACATLSAAWPSSGANSSAISVSVKIPGALPFRHVDQTAPLIEPDRLDSHAPGRRELPDRE